MLRTKEELEAVLDRISYKPGWDFAVWHDEPTNTFGLGISAQLTNSWPPHDTVVVGQSDIIPVPIEEKQFISIVKFEIHRLERHETQEWLKLDHVYMDAPH